MPQGFGRLVQGGSLGFVRGRRMLCLGAVRTHQMQLRWQTEVVGQFGQRPPGDGRHVHPIDRREVAEQDRHTVEEVRRGRRRHDRRQCAVHVGRDEQRARALGDRSGNRFGFVERFGSHGHGINASRNVAAQ